ncbi:MAG: glycosyltransferase N-terminal domain-containing protein [Ferruginibacter sp.]
MTLFLYSIFLKLFSAGIKIAAFFNPKAQRWIKGRLNWWEQLQTLDRDAEKPTIWMHCASLGEFEQGRPLLEAIRLKYPATCILLTFFSPSGYEVRKNYAGADLVMYLPIDSKENAHQFINYLKPSLVLWVKYEYWYYYLLELKQQKVPVLLISGIFRNSQPFFKAYGQLWKNMLGSFEQLFVQNLYSLTLLKSIGFNNKATVTGDTRFDRVCSIAAEWESLPEPLSSFCNLHPVIVAGSTWEEDEELLIHYSKTYPHIRFVIAPHEVSKERIEDLQEEFPNGILYSNLLTIPTEEIGNRNVLIIDNIGMLSRLYHYAHIAYVGGGFNDSGIHNILEAAVYSKPVIFGPEYDKFAEARDLVEAGAAFSIETALELEALLNELINNKILWKESSQIAGDYVQQHRGATEKIMQYIQEKRLLIN